MVLKVVLILVLLLLVFRLCVSFQVEKRDLAEVPDGFNVFRSMNCSLACEYAEVSWCPGTSKAAYLVEFRTDGSALPDFYSVEFEGTCFRHVTIRLQDQDQGDSDDSDYEELVIFMHYSSANLVKAAIPQPLDGKECLSEFKSLQIFVRGSPVSHNSVTGGSCGLAPFGSIDGILKGIGALFHLRFPVQLSQHVSVCARWSLRSIAFGFMIWTFVAMFVPQCSFLFVVGVYDFIMGVSFIPLTLLGSEEEKAPCAIHTSTVFELFSFSVQVASTVRLMQNCGKAMYELNICNCCTDAVLLVVHVVFSARIVQEAPSNRIYSS